MSRIPCGSANMTNLIRILLSGDGMGWDVKEGA